MKYRIFETHAHYDDESFDEDRDSLLEELLSTDVEKIVNIGADIESSKKAVEIANRHEGVLAAVGVHPDMIDTLHCYESENLVLDEIRQLAKNQNVVAIGEIGLDYYERSEFEKPKEVRERQKFWFKAQLDLAKELGLPVVIHSRDAGEDTYQVLKEHHPALAVVHCFSYSAEMAERFVKLGFFIGIGGVVTFQNAKKIIEVVKRVGIKNLVLETDSPYLAPVPFRGKRNDSSKIKYVVEKLAQLLEISEEEVLKVTHYNALKLYNLKEG